MGSCQQIPYDGFSLPDGCEDAREASPDHPNFHGSLIFHRYVLQRERGPAGTAISLNHLETYRLGTSRAKTTTDWLIICQDRVLTWNLVTKTRKY